MGKITFEKMRELAKQRGITSYTIKVNSSVSIGQATWKKLMNDESTVSTGTIAELCKLLQCQPGDLMEYVPEDKDAE